MRLKNNHSSCRLHISLFLLIGYITSFAASSAEFESLRDSTFFAGWTEERYQQYEDSILNAKYPPGVVRKAEFPNFGLDQTPTPLSFSGRSATVNPHVPTSREVLTDRIVGGIPFKSGVSPLGIRTVSVPLDLPEGNGGHTPSLSISYSSNTGDSPLGRGWYLEGVSVITRGGKDIYHNGVPDRMRMDVSDSFWIDGNRLLPTDSGDIPTHYISEFGFIKAVRHLSGGVTTGFDVYWPDGRHGYFTGTFDDDTDVTERLFYPVASLSDLRGNSISYSYSTLAVNVFPKLTGIDYNGNSVRLDYRSASSATRKYQGGIDITEQYLLKKVTVRGPECELASYGLEYEFDSGLYFLKSIGSERDGQSLTPLTLYYGTGRDATQSRFSSRENLFDEYWDLKPASTLAVRGRFDFNSSSDGLAVTKVANPYWKSYRSPNLFRHSENYFSNKYSGTEKILVYSSLDGQQSVNVSTLETGEGFIGMFTADIEGKGVEELVVARNTLMDDIDFLHIDTYTVSSGNLVKKRTTRYEAKTVFTDANGNKSVQPKYLFPGDFNGDGATDILIVSADNPFDEGTRPSKCLVYDFKNSCYLYANNLFAYKLDFLGTVQQNEVAVSNNSDKILVIDVDGDGKSELLHFGEESMKVYSFFKSGLSSGYECEVVSENYSLKKERLENKNIVCGDFNGDGLVDFALSPDYVEYGSGIYKASYWQLYTSKGDGTFRYSAHAEPSLEPNSGTWFFAQDVNRDGCADLVEVDEVGVWAWLSKSGVPSVATEKTPAGYIDCFVPLDITAPGKAGCLLSVAPKKGFVWNFDFNGRTESLLTGVAGGDGVVEHTSYAAIDGDDDGVSSGYFSPAWHSDFPFVGLTRDVTVVTATSKWLKGTQREGRTFFYNDAVSHRQGLGFLGFSSVTSTDMWGRVTRCCYSPEKFGLPLSETTPEYHRIFDYLQSVGSNRKVRVQLIKESEDNYLNGISSKKVFSYDSHDSCLSESLEYSDWNSINTTYSYADNDIYGEGYFLSFPTGKSVTTTRTGISAWNRTETVEEHDRCLPLRTVVTVNGETAVTTSVTYDPHGNNVSETSRKGLSGSSLTTSRDYDTYGRIVSETDEAGLTTSYSYDSRGNVASITDPRGNTAAYSYDALGREILASFPDGNERGTVYEWSKESEESVYRKTETFRDDPKAIQWFDYRGNVVREADGRFDGSIRLVEREYDGYGRLIAESLPYKDMGDIRWKTITRDSHGRPVETVWASGKTVGRSYSGLTETISENGTVTRKTYDSFGNLVKVSDSGGDIVYFLNGMGNPIEIEAPGGAVTRFRYDALGRKTMMSDPSAGITRHEYDDDGNEVTVVTAEGETISHSYDALGRLTGSVYPEMSVSRTYTAFGDPETVETSGGGYSSRKEFSYDNLGRVTSEKDYMTGQRYWFSREYSYERSRLSGIRYCNESRNSGDGIATENYSYTNGSLTGITLSNGLKVFELLEEDDLGNPTGVRTGDLLRRSEFTPNGYPSFSAAYRGDSDPLFSKSYVFDEARGNLLLRRDHPFGQEESFGYDGLDRLVSHRHGTLEYSPNGNITRRSETGDLYYDHPDKPYALTEIEDATEVAPEDTQEITYASFKRPLTVNDGGNVSLFKYDGDGDRVEWRLCKKNSSYVYRYYAGDCYVYEANRSGKPTFQLYLGGDYYTAPVVFSVDHKGEGFHYILRDYLGSVTETINADGTVEGVYRYDAWGRQVEPMSGERYALGEEPDILFSRGFTGHEHLPGIRLVNMNARLYDPYLGRFLSPDPNVQEPEGTQNFNRFSYALNNPMRYIDRDGEFFWFAVGAAAMIGGAGNIYAHFDEITSAGGGWKSFVSAAKYFGVGALAGGASTALSMGMASWIGGAAAIAGTAATTVRFSTVCQQMLIDGMSGGLDGFITSMGNSLIAGKSFKESIKEGTKEGLFSASSNALLSGASFIGINKGYKKEKHHVATNKNKKFTPKLKELLGKVGLDLNGKWNILEIYHRGRHPDAYHEFILNNIRIILREEGITAKRFIDQFNEKCITPLLKNPEMLWKQYWINLKKKN